MGAAAGNGGEGALCEKKRLQAELKEEPEGQPLTPGPPLLGSTGGLELQCVWSEATSSGMIQENNGPLTGSAEQGGVQLDNSSSVRRCRASRRLRSVRGRRNDILAEMLFPLDSPGECDGSTPCEASFHTSAEEHSGRKRTEGQAEEFVCTCCGKTFPDALELKTHEELHNAGGTVQLFGVRHGFHFLRRPGRTPEDSQQGETVLLLCV